MISFPSNKSYIKVKEKKQKTEGVKKLNKIKLEIVSIIKGENRVYGVKRSEEKVKRDAFFFFFYSSETHNPSRQDGSCGSLNPQIAKAFPHKCGNKCYKCRQGHAAAVYLVTTLRSQSA